MSDWITWLHFPQSFNPQKVFVIFKDVSKSETWTAENFAEQNNLLLGSTTGPRILWFLPCHAFCTTYMVYVVSS